MFRLKGSVLHSTKKKKVSCIKKRVIFIQIFSLIFVLIFSRTPNRPEDELQLKVDNAQRVRVIHSLVYVLVFFVLPTDFIH